MDIEENPVPTEARQRTFGPSAGQCVLIASLEIPLRLGPRHWGQSAAGETEKASIAANNAMASFIRRILALGTKKSMNAEAQGKELCYVSRSVGSAPHSGAFVARCWRHLRCEGERAACRNQKRRNAAHSIRFAWFDCAPGLTRPSFASPSCQWGFVSSFGVGA